MALSKILALVLTAITLVPSAAHLFELPGKIGLEREPYFIVQTIYAGWSLFAIPIIGAIFANVLLTFMLWRANDGRAAWSALSAALIAASLAVFFVWVFPGNRETANWTMQPENWEMLRRNWEYGHATNAVIVFVAFIATSMASVGRDSRGDANVRNRSADDADY